MYNRFVVLSIAIWALIGPQAWGADAVPGGSCSKTNAWQWSGDPESGGTLYGMFCTSGAWTSSITLSSKGLISIPNVGSTVNIYGELTFQKAFTYVASLAQDTSSNFTIVNGGSTLLINAAGQTGINTKNAQATLDVNGYVRLARYSAQPIACSSSNDGAISLTHAYTLCVCKGGSAGWVKAADGATACSW